MAIGGIEILKPSSDEQLIPYEDDGDKSRKTHVVWEEMNRHILEGEGVSGQDIVDMARMTGAEVTALCGYKFVPVHDPEKYDACKPCIDLAGKLMGGSDD
jgi:hypothetical protein